ncbi:MAG: flagellar biosynthetic protein FliO [Gammaproteobacteria bacterium]
MRIPRSPSFCPPCVTWLCLCACPGAVAATRDVLSPARIGQTLVVLAAIVASLFALGYLARRLPGLAARTGTRGALKLVDALSLGARERIVLVEVDGERLVLGVSPGRIERLHVSAAPVAGGFGTVLAEVGRVQESTP